MITDKRWKSLYDVMLRSAVKYPFYDAKFSYRSFDKSEVARKISKTHVPWAKRAVNMRANKTNFDTFENDTIGLGDLFKKYRGPQALNKIKKDILICGVGFLGIDNGRIMPFTGMEATGTYDWREQNLSSGVAVYQQGTERRAHGTNPIPDSYIEYRKDITRIVDNGVEYEVRNKTGRPLMTLLTAGSTTRKPFGSSIINRAVRDAVIDASRINRQAMIAAHHYNTKVDVLLGLDTNSDMTKMQTSTGDALVIGPNDNGQIPQVAQFAQHAMAPFKDSMLIPAQNFCTETSLSLANIGITSNAPDSPEALEIVGDDLRDDILDWQAEIGDQLKYFATTLYMHHHGLSEIDENLQKKIDAINVVWKPIFRGDISKFGDGLTKIVPYAPGIVRQRSVWRKAGLASGEIDDVIGTINTSEEL